MSTASLNAVVGYVRRLAERDTHGQTDRQLLDRFTRHRDEAAFAELVRRHGPMVLSACRRVLRHEQDAEDAFQAAFLVLARKAGSIRQHDSVGGWLYQVARRLAVRTRITCDRRRERFTPLNDEFAAPGPDLPADALRTSLDEELDRLPEPYRSAIVLCYLEGRTQSEAARLLATTADAVNSRLKRARDLLRQRLVRRGLAFSAAALAAGAAQAALPPALVRLTAQNALNFMTNGASACGASALAVVLAKGALHSMITPKFKILSVLVLAMTLLAAGALLLPPPALGDKPGTPSARDDSRRTLLVDEEDGKTKPDGEAKPQRACILLWMSGGPSQIDTFDPKPGDANGALFPAIDTAVKGLQISQNLPGLAKLTNHLAILRSVTHREGDHARGSCLMRTGYTQDGKTDYPALGCVLAKELGEGLTDLPRYISIAPQWDADTAGYGPGILGRQYAPLAVGGRGGFGGKPQADNAPPLPPADDFEALVKGKGEAMRKAVAKAFDLTEEKAGVRDAYGRGTFGQGCLLARRLVERGVPVVEVTLPGWDMHANIPKMMPKTSGELDAALAALLKDLHERKRLDTTLIVWMGEFGRTPRINNGEGRDHWPFGFSVVLAGCGIKGGQAIGKTSADGTKIDEHAVSPAELYATIYKALGIDPAKETHCAATNRQIPLVEKEARAGVKEALR